MLPSLPLEGVGAARGVLTGVGAGDADDGLAVSIGPGVGPERVGGASGVCGPRGTSGL